MLQENFRIFGLLLFIATSFIGFTECSPINQNNVKLNEENKQNKSECVGSILTVKVNYNITLIKLISIRGETLFNVGSNEANIYNFQELIFFYTKTVSTDDGKPKDGDIYLQIHNNELHVEIVRIISNKTLFRQDIRTPRKPQPTRCTHPVGYMVQVPRNLNVNYRDTFGVSVLYWILSLGTSGQAIDAMNKGADFNVSAEEGFYLLAAPIISNKCNILEYILKHRDIQVNRFMALGQTLLHIAVYSQRIHCARLLLDHGADISRKTNDSLSWTPLHAAAHFENLDLVKELIRRGADLTLKDSYQRTPLLVAVEKGNVKISSEIINYLMTPTKMTYVQVETTNECNTCDMTNFRYKYAVNAIRG